MSNGRSTIARPIGARPLERRRRLAAVLGGVAVSGLMLGGLAGPVIADGVSGGGNADASVGIEGDCVVAAAGTDGAGGSDPQSGNGAPSGHDLTAAGDGGIEASMCRSDLEGVVDDVLGSLPEDPADPLPGDPGGGLPGDPGGGLPGDPGGGLPGDPGDALPCDPAGLLPDGVFGLAPDLVSRLACILPGLIGTGGPGGSHGDRPATVTPASGSAPPSHVFGGTQRTATAPEGRSPGGQMEPMAPVPAGAAELIPAGATLPRTGGALGTPLLRILAFAAASRGVFRLAGRRARDRS